MYLFLLSCVALQRLIELQIASSNEAYLRRRGAIEYGEKHYPVMVALHSFWLLSCLVEWWSGTQTALAGVVLGWLMLLCGQTLRWATIRTLGRRWTTRVLVLPGEPLVKGGPFQWISHPNYLGVVLEIFGLPLIGGCWKTSLTFGLLNLLLLKYRISIENTALTWASKGQNHELSRTV